MTMPDHTPVCAQGRQLQQWGGLFSHPPHSPDFSIPQLPSYWPPEGYTPRKPFCNDNKLTYGGV